MDGWIVFEIGINIFQGFMMVYFINHFTHAFVHSWWIDFLSIFVISTFLSLYLFFEIPIIDTVLFTFPFFHSCFVSKEKWYVRLFWTGILALVFIGVINIVCSICMQLLQIPWNVIMSENQFRMAYLLVGNVSILIVLLIVSRIGEKKSRVSRGSFGLLIILITLLLLSIELLFMESTQNPNSGFEYVLSNILLFAAVIVALLLYKVLTTSTEKRLQIESELQSISSIREHHTELKNMYGSMLKNQHDLRHQLQVIEELAKNHADEVMVNRLGHCEHTLLEERQFLTGNISVDAILTAKKATMDLKQIMFDYQPYSLDRLPIDEIKFCIVLANLLDNAIEATERICSSKNKRWIGLSIAKSQDMLFINCRNTYEAKTIKKKGEKFISSKNDTVGHGFGIESMRSICSSYGGYCDFSCSGTLFNAKIVLPYNDGCDG